MQINEYLIDSGLVPDDVPFLMDLTWTIYNQSRATVSRWGLSASVCSA